MHKKNYIGFLRKRRIQYPKSNRCYNLRTVFMKKYFKLDFKFWLNIVTFGALAFLIVISWDQIREAFFDLARLNIWVLLLIIPIQLVSYFAIARLYKDFFDAQGERISLKEMYKVALELNFVNHVFPSGGVSGFSYLSIRLKAAGISTSKSTLAQILRFALTFISFILLLLIALVVLAFGKNTSPFIILICSTIIGSTIFGSAVGIFIISKASRIKAFVSWLPKALNYVFRYFKKGKEIINISKVEDTLEDLHDDYKVLSKDMRLIKWLLVWALIINVVEVLTIYIVYIAFGSPINVGALIIAYAVANFAGLIAILPGGVGVYEGLMTAVLTGAGVPKALALSATVLYRILTMVLFLPVGYVFYNRALKQVAELRDRTKAQTEHSDVAEEV